MKSFYDFTGDRTLTNRPISEVAFLSNAVYICISPFKASLPINERQSSTNKPMLKRPREPNRMALESSHAMI